MAKTTFTRPMAPRKSPSSPLRAKTLANRIPALTGGLTIDPTTNDLYVVQSGLAASSTTSRLTAARAAPRWINSAPVS